MASAKQQIDGYSYAPVAAVPIYGDDGEEDPLAESFFGAAVASSAETVSPTPGRIWKSWPRRRCPR